LNKFSLIKSIEAKKLNKRTLIPLTDPEVTIPFGAIIENVEADRDMDRFTCNGDPYRCPHERLATAMAPIGAAPLPAPAAQPEVESPAQEKAQAAFQWEPLNSSHGSLMRAKVPGGWLVAAAGAGLAFYPDPGHAWDGTSSS
jgi:hypothetical protein